MNNQMKFEDLESWQKAREVTRDIYLLTRDSAVARDFGLCSQIQRAAVSVMSNVAEGFERWHVQEKVQFYNVARGSNAETRSLLYVLEDNYPSISSQAIRLREEVVQAGKLVSGLIQSTEARRRTSA